MFNRVVSYTAAGLMTVTAVWHLVIAPTHYADLPPHGLFFGALGVAQFALAMVLLDRLILRIAAGRGLLAAGMVLSGGAVVAWLYSRWAAPPFGAPLDVNAPETFVRQGLAWLAFACFISLEVARVKPLLIYRPVAAPLVMAGVIALISGTAMWVSGRISERYVAQGGWPALLASTHNHSTHDHSLDAAIVAQVNAAAQAKNSAYPWNLPANFPPPAVPDDNPMTPEKVELGRHLFYDVRLSGNGTQSCGSCHIQKLAFSDGKTVGIGSTGQAHSRNPMALVNVAYNASQTWANPIITTLEGQALLPMFGESPVELGITGRENEVLARFRDDPLYQQLFKAAYPDAPQPTWRTIAQAIASFQRTLISANSRFDQFVRGNVTALSEKEKIGAALFFGEDLECHHCHTGFNFSQATMHSGSTFIERPFFNTGLYDLDGKGAYPPDNRGIYEITLDPNDMGKFRPPTLRNIALTAPYMHDGSMKTLNDVIRFYERGGHETKSGPNAGDGRLNPFKNGLVSGFRITDDERDALISFLNALTDEQFVSDPRFSDPFSNIFTK
ncbi:MAG: di-heme enzyme [Anaerolineae bacterium]|nr:di-heme enzyme [Anaerolineae bacterium]